MRKQIALLFLLILVTEGAYSSQPELLIYTYDSFVSKDGLGPAVLPVFEKKWNCKVRVQASGDGGQLLTRLQLDGRRGKSQAHIVIGIDQQIWKRAQPWVELWGSWRPQGYEDLASDSLVEPGFLPYDYGVFAFLANTRLLEELKLKSPSSVSDLIQSQWKRKILMEDPRTSTPGLAFLLFTQTILGKGVWEFWTQFRNQWLTLAPGWDSAYGLFLKNEAPLVWTYLSSQAYQEEKAALSAPSQHQQYQAILFKEGQPFQIEGAALVKNSIRSEEQRVLARKFLEFLISPEVQEMIPRKNWMMPVRRGMSLPESFKSLPKPKKLIPVSTEAQAIEATLDQWRQVIGR